MSGVLFSLLSFWLFFSYSLNGTSSYSKAWEESIIPPHPDITKDVNVEEFLLVSGGPAPPFPQSKGAFQLPQTATFGVEAAQIMHEVKYGLQYLFQTNNSYTLALLGTGNMGIEVVFTNLVEPGDKVLIFPYGGWSLRTADVISRQGGIPITPQKPLGVAFSLDEIEGFINLHKPSIVHLIMGESSFALFQDVEGVGQLCKDRGCLTTIDACHIMGIQPFFMDKWGIDGVFTNVQKGIGAPVGLVPVSFSSRAVSKAMSRKTRPHTQINDIQYWTLQNFWKVYDPKKAAGVVHSTPLLLLYTLREALRKLCKEGLPSLWRKHAQVNGHFRKELIKEFPMLKEFVEVEDQRLIGEVLVWVPEGMDSKQVADYLHDKYKMEVGVGTSEVKGRVLRFAFIGANCDPVVAERTLAAVGEGLRHFNVSKVISNNINGL